MKARTRSSSSCKACEGPEKTGKGRPAGKGAAGGPDARVRLASTLGNRAFGRLLQAKLKIGAPDDPYEREADRVADQILRMPRAEPPVVTAAPAGVQRACAACVSGGTTCPACRTGDEETIRPPPATLRRAPLRAPQEVRIPMDSESNRNERTAQRLSGELPGGPAAREDRVVRAAGLAPLASADSSAVLSADQAAQVLAPQGGSPMAANLRSEFEARLGADFAAVRIHQGPRASALAEQLDARAFTFGNHVWLGGQERQTDRWLMAHELTHVVQQSRVQPASHRIQAARRHYYALPRLGRGVGGGPGTRTHTYVLDILGHAEEAQGEELFTEVPIPGGAASGGTGRADLFKTDTRRMLGVQFSSDGRPSFLRIAGQTRHNGSDASQAVHVATAAPAGNLRSRACAGQGLPRGQGICRMQSGTAPGRVEIGDLKPNYEAETLLGGADQIPRYIDAVEGLRDQANAFATANPDLVRPRGASWSVSAHRLRTLNVPQEYTQPSSSSPQVEAALYVDDVQTRVRKQAVILIDTSGNGIWTYEFIPVDQLGGGSRGGGGAGSSGPAGADGIDQAATALTPVKNALNEGPGRDRAGGARTARARSGRQRPRDSFNYTSWRNDRFYPWRRRAERATGGRGDAALRRPSQDARRRLEAEAAAQIHERTGLAGVRAPAGTAARTRELERVQHWIDHGTVYGRLRQVFGRAYVRIAGTYERLRERVQRRVAATRRRLRGGSSGIGARAAVLGAMKAVVGALLVVFVRDVGNRLMGSLRAGAQSFLDDLLSDQTEDLRERLARIERLQEELRTGVAEAIEARFGAQISAVQERLGQVERAVETFSGITRLVNLALWAYRIAQCGAPPLLGCIISIFGSAIAEAAIAAIVASCWFKREILFPAMLGLEAVSRLPGVVAGAIAGRLRAALPESLRGLVGPVDTSGLEAGEEDVGCDDRSRYNRLSPNQARMTQLFSAYDPEHVAAFLEAMRHLGVATDDPNPNTSLTSETEQMIRSLLDSNSAERFREIVETTPARPPRAAAAGQMIQDLDDLLRRGASGESEGSERLPEDETSGGRSGEPSSDAAESAEASARRDLEEAREVVRRLAAIDPAQVQEGRSRFNRPRDFELNRQYWVFVHGKLPSGMLYGAFELVTFVRDNGDGTYDVTLRGGARYFRADGQLHVVRAEDRQATTLPD